MKKPPNITTAPTGQIAPFGLRMLPDLREKIEASAKANNRSMNAEIVARLQDSFLTKSHDEVIGQARELYEMAQGLIASSERLIEQHKAQARSVARLATDIIENPHPESARLLIELAKNLADEPITHTGDEPAPPTPLPRGRRTRKTGPDKA